ncbi:MAG: hypothetical protein IJ506_06495 [Clostridia bacterium]|nr:hypothetical protein [Clostridia bacterium]
MKSCEKRNYEPISFKIRLINTADVITASPTSVDTTDGMTDAPSSWVD